MQSNVGCARADAGSRRHDHPARLSLRGTILLAATLCSLAGFGQKKELEEAHSLQQKGSLREARKAYQSLLPQLSGSERAAALQGLSQIANSQGEYDAGISVATEATAA